MKMRNFKAMPNMQGGWFLGAAIIGSAIIGAVSSKKAGKQQAAAAQQGLDKQLAVAQPYVDAGQAGLSGLQQFVDNGAKFSDTQAFKDIINTQKSDYGGGSFNSGNTMTALTDYYATNFRPQRLNELSMLPKMGQAAAAGQAANIGTAYDTMGSARAAGTLGMANSINNGISQFMFLDYLKKNPQVTPPAVSDMRLKENIQKVGEVQGQNIYTWNWNDIAIAKGVDTPTIGVIAQEVDPQFVSTDPDGYLRVDYGRLFNAN